MYTVQTAERDTPISSNYRKHFIRLPGLRLLQPIYKSLFVNMSGPKKLHTVFIAITLYTLNQFS